MSGNADCQLGFDDDAPVLWVHFLELHRVISRLRYTRDATTWRIGTAQAGGKSGGTWSEAVDRTATEFANNIFQTGDCYPHANSTGDWHPTEYDAHLSCGVNSMATCAILSTAVTHTVRYYYLPVACGSWGGDGGGVAEGSWGSAGVDGPNNASNSSSSLIGALGSAPWCAAPTASNTHTEVGWRVGQNVAVIEWDMYTPAIKNPMVEDSDEDGLVVDADACGCSGGACRLPGSDPEWLGLKADPRVRLPLGISSGLTNAAIGVKAYVTEFEVDGVPRQMYSLDTSVIADLFHSAPSTSPWRFAVVRRPSGAEIVFALKGAKAGRPVDTHNNYRMQIVDTGFELRFPEADVVHCFDSSVEGGAINQVRKGTVALNGTPNAWPSMVVSRTGGLITSVASPFGTALPTYSGSLIESIEYRDATNNHIETLRIGAGMRVHRYLRQLVDLELIAAAHGRNGCRFVYQLADCPRASLTAAGSGTDAAQWRNA